MANSGHTLVVAQAEVRALEPLPAKSAPHTLCPSTVMTRLFWIKRLAMSFVVAFAALALTAKVKGAATPEAIVFGLIWGAITALIFTGVGYYRFRRNPACMTKAPQAER